MQYKCVCNLNQQILANVSLNLVAMTIKRIDFVIFAHTQIDFILYFLIDENAELN